MKTGILDLPTDGQSSSFPLERYKYCIRYKFYFYNILTLTRAGASLNAAPGIKKFCPPSSNNYSSTFQLSQKFVTINDLNFPDTVMKLLLVSQQLQCHCQSEIQKLHNNTSTCNLQLHLLCHITCLYDC